MKQIVVYAFVIFTTYFHCEGQTKSDPPNVVSNGPRSITRNLIQDRKGDIWFATWEGVFRFDGKSFSNMTSEVTSARFFSALEDRNGNLWFGTIGSGVYVYDGYFFKNYTTTDGLINNEITCIYQDKAGHIWFGANGGTSRYDGRSFRNYTMKCDTMNEDKTGKSLPDVRPPNEVNSIIEDNAGNLWFATRGKTFIYNGKEFNVFADGDNGFTNVRTILQDKSGNIWFGGNDGLWRYDGKLFMNLTKDFGGFVYEDRAGNIWTSTSTQDGWALSRYDKKLLAVGKFVPTIIKSKEGMVFGILEAVDGSIWFGTANGVYRYDGSSIVGFNGTGLE